MGIASQIIVKCLIVCAIPTLKLDATMQFKACDCSIVDNVELKVVCPHQIFG